jgi:hypothetical protein
MALVAELLAALVVEVGTDWHLELHQLTHYPCLAAVRALAAVVVNVDQEDCHLLN